MAGHSSWSGTHARPPCSHLQTDDGSTALRLAVSRGDLPLTRALLAVGADKDALGADGIPLLLLAVETSQPVAVALIEARADYNLEDGAGRTALEVAVERGQVELCELLLAKGARPNNRKDEAGETSLHVAVRPPSCHARPVHSRLRELTRSRARTCRRARRCERPRR